MTSHSTNRLRPRNGFTLIELLIATAILGVILTIVLGMTSQANKLWSYSTSKIEPFQNARFAFETLTTTLSGATLNTYYDYYDSRRARRTASNSSAFTPSVYGRYSELEFVCGKSLLPAQKTHAIFFQAPTGYTAQSGTLGKLNSLLNSTGFYLTFGNNAAEIPSFVNTTARYRYRLMQLMQPTENLSLYGSGTSGHQWFTAPVENGGANVRLLAENVIALIVWPKLPEETAASATLSPGFEYDSNIDNATPQKTWTAGTQPLTMNQLPPMVHIVMITVDERSMSRLQGNSVAEPELGFNYAEVFQSADQLDRDLETVAQALIRNKLNYRIFQTDVALRGAKWSP